MNGSQSYRTQVRPRLTELPELMHLEMSFTLTSGCYFRLQSRK